jgi:hypothetical protein
MWSAGLSAHAKAGGKRLPRPDRGGEGHAHGG